jgi:HD-GYP domain-containing protein (c-di-GMP phosphodiesterase class II)
VRSCHERWDGKGYPDQLKGEQIPLAARIVFVCDAYNAMTTDRPYRAAMKPAAAIKELVDNAGTQFDPLAVAGLVSVIEQGTAAVTTADGVRALLANRPTPEGAGAAS